MVLKQLEVQQTNKILQEQQQNYTHLDTKFQLPPNSKWITNLYVKLKTIKLIDENTGENLDNLRFGNESSGITLNAQPMKEITKLQFIKI